MAAASAYDQMIASMDAFGGEVGTNISNILDVGEYLTNQDEAGNDADLNRQQHLGRNDTEMALKGGHASSGSRTGNQYADEAAAKLREKTYEGGRGPANAIQATLGTQQQIQELKEDIGDLRDEVADSDLSTENKRRLDQKLNEADRLAAEGRLDEAREMQQEAHELKQELEAGEETVQEQVQDITGNKIKTLDERFDQLGDQSASLFAGHPAIGQLDSAPDSADSQQSPDAAEIETAIDQKIQDIQQNTLKPLEDKLAEMKETIQGYKDTVDEFRDKLEDTYGLRGQAHYESLLQNAEHNLEEMQDKHDDIQQVYDSKSAILETGQEIDIQALHDALTDDGKIDLKEWQQEIANNTDNPEALADIAEYMKGKLGENFSDDILASYGIDPDNAQDAQNNSPSDTAEHNGADADQPQTVDNSAQTPQQDAVSDNSSASSIGDPLSFEPLAGSAQWTLSGPFTEAAQKGKEDPAQAQTQEQEQTQDQQYHAHPAAEGGFTL